MLFLKKRPKKAAVLGCGPAGMFAAHALIEAGWEVDILSKKRRSEMFGAQYLHRPIPGLIDKSTVINYLLRGHSDDYRRKVYGTNAPYFMVSPDIFTGPQPAWDIRAAYYDAWDRYHDRIKDTVLDGWTVKEILLDDTYRFVISTIPAKDLCIQPSHIFKSQEVWAIGDAPERGVFCPIPAPTDTVICDGTVDVSWYRASNVFGYKTCEWPNDRKPPVPGVALVLKPISTDCTCWEESGRWYRTGRYGNWNKLEYSHTGYEVARDLVKL